MASVMVSWAESSALLGPLDIDVLAVQFIALQFAQGILSVTVADELNECKVRVVVLSRLDLASIETSIPPE